MLKKDVSDYARIRPEAASRRLQIPIQVIYRWIKRGDLPVEKDLKGSYTILASQLWRYYFKAFQVRADTRRMGTQEDIEAYKDALWESIKPNAVVSTAKRACGRASE